MHLDGDQTKRLSTATLTSLALFASMASAVDTGSNKRHVQLVTPAPFEWDQYGPTNPLSPDGSDYPCKVAQGDAFAIAGGGTPAEMVIGEPQTVRFSGWAVHGGGSCQFALAEGLAPTRDSAWKVIRSVEGGCPKANATGNLAPGEDPDAYTFAVPDDFAPGNYTWAWTWVNRIGGSPEFYMNCAPVTVKAAAAASASAGRRRPTTTRRRDQQRRAAAAAAAGSTTSTTYNYPDLFLANIGSASNGCDTSEALYQQVAIAYPHPGNSVSRPNGQESLYEQSCDGNPRNNGGGSTASTSTSTSASPAATSTSSELLSSLSSSVPTSPTSSTSVATMSSSSSSSVAAPTTSATTNSTTTTTTLDSPCTDGHLLCVGGTQFSTCTGGAWNAPQDLAADTTCDDEGESVGLDTTYHWA